MVHKQLELTATSIRSIKRPTIFTFKMPLNTSQYIRAMHPKTQIRPDAEAIRRILEAGWVGQLKIHGHRAQIHIPAEDTCEVSAYTRHGRLHKKLLSDKMIKEIRRVFRPQKGWTVLDAEWLKPKEKLYVFDVLRKDGELLRKYSYPDRWAMIPKHFLSPHIEILPLIRTFEGCMKVIKARKPIVEGLVFKSGTAPGFADTSIVRCRCKVG